MPKGPNGQKRPADAIGLAVMIGKIATGEIEDTPAATKSAANVSNPYFATRGPRAGGEMGSCDVMIQR